MTRDWEAEWVVLMNREREAFEQYRGLQFEVSGHFQQTGIPPHDLLTDTEAAHVSWEEAKAACDVFIEEYKSS